MRSSRLYTAIALTAVALSLAPPPARSCGLEWLARHQSPDGCWHAGGFEKECAPGMPCGGRGDPSFDVGVSGLATLAFLGAGYTPLYRPSYEDPHTHLQMGFGSTVKRALSFLEKEQDEGGCVGPRTGAFMLRHAIAALALNEGYGLTNGIALRGAAQRATSFIVTSQKPGSGWSEVGPFGACSTEVTGWCVMALKSAQISGLEVPKESLESALAYVRAATAPNGVVGTGTRGIGASPSEGWAAHPLPTAIGLVAHIFVERKRCAAGLDEQAAILASDLPAWDDGPGRAGRKVDFTYWYHGSLALFQLDGPHGSKWSAWNDALKKALVEHQRLRADGCEDGSWDPGADRCGAFGGRVYATAMNTLSLEIYYRYASVFPSRSSGSRRQATPFPAPSASTPSRSRTPSR